MIKFAVVGLGHIGKRHVEMIRRNPDAELAAVCDVLSREETGLEATVDVIEFRQGNSSSLAPVKIQGLVKHGNVTLKMGYTILVVEHDMKLIMNISDYIYVLCQGSLLAEGTPAEIQNNPDVIAAYLGGDE